MDTDALKTFCSVARLRSVSKAADSLGLNQTTATMHIKRLEQELGAVLFDRTQRPIELTEAGRIIYQRTFPLVEALKGMMEEVSSVTRAEAITIASTVEITMRYLPRIVLSFREQCPDVRLVLKAHERVEIASLIKSGTVDVGITVDPEITPEVGIEHLSTYSRVLIGPIGHPLLGQSSIAWEDVARWPLVLQRSSNTTRRLLESEFQRRGLSHDIVMELDSVETIKRYVALGIGISFTPSSAIEPQDRERLASIECRGLFPESRIAMVTLKGSHKTLAVQRFQDEVRRCFSRGENLPVAGELRT